MPRTREFDIDEALESAMEQFWRRGYEATSMSDLLDCIGIHKGSLYKAFGAKHSLYLAALEHYLSGARDEARAALEGGESARAALRSWIGAAVRRCSCSEASRKGCFGVNAIAELAPHDEDVRALTRQHTRRLEGLVAETIRRGQRQGDFRPNGDPTKLAQFVVTAVFGLYVKSKVARPSRRNAEELVDITLSALE